MGRAEFFGGGEAGGDEVDCDDGAYLEVGGGEDAGHADGAEAVDGDA